MAAPRKYPEELQERAIRMAVDARKDPATRSGAIARVGSQLGINAETLRSWVTQAEIDGRIRPGDDDRGRSSHRRARAENRELRRANDILKTASAFFAQAELDRRLK